MVVKRDWVGKVKAVLGEARPQAETPESQARRAFQLYEFNVHGPVVEQTPRARAKREIGRIAAWYGWTMEITRALDAACATCLAELDDASIEALQRRMRQLEECAQTGVGAPDAPPAV